MNPLFGMKVIVSLFAYEQVKGERLFPASRHRSRRIHKKLVKRYGGEFRTIYKPTAYQVGRDTLVVHPVIYEEMKKACPSTPPH